ncbi:coiled-coil domain-containing protein 55-domain containing protein [Aspergillus oleicola]
MPPKSSIGINLTKKPNPLAGASAKRKKAVFDNDSDAEDNNGRGAGAANETEITTIGGLGDDTSAPAESRKQQEGPPMKRKIVPLGQAPKPKVKPLSKGSIFADDEGDENGQEGGESKTYGLNAPTTNTKQSDSDREYTNLSAMHSSKKHLSEATDLDPSIYSYDAVYDSLHTKPTKNNQSNNIGAEAAPRYMTSLLRSAEIRKRDQLRARDRMLAKEREAEGDEFHDKEKFVTGAYKAQQEELRRVEEEEKAREAEEEERRRKNGGSGMVGFYRDLLSKGEEEHNAAMKAADEAAKKMKDGEVPTETEQTAGEKTEAQKAADLNAAGAHIAINDEGQVVDKRQLLSAGLNVAPKPKTAAPAPTRTAPGAGAKPRFDSRQASGRAGQRARQTEMIAEQLEEQERQREEAEAAKQKEIAERSRSQRTSTEVSSARERYLARKKEREAAAKGS